MNHDAIVSLLAAVRESCSPATWSRAVELARDQSVVGESATDEEIRLRVTTDDALVCPTVSLWPIEQDWFCDCSSAEGAACIHVAAAIIALRQARKSGQVLPQPRKATGRLAYRFRRTPSGLTFHRVVVTEGTEQTLQTTLSAALSSGSQRFVADHTDLAVERSVGSHRSGVPPRLVLSGLLDALIGSPEVQLDGAPVRVERPERPIHVRIDDCGEGYRLTAVQAPSITELFDNGAVLCGDALCALGEPNLMAREIEELRAGKVIAERDAAYLVTDLLPSLQERVPVHVASKRLPSVDRDLLPRLLIDTKRDGDELSVLASIVYGDPPAARLDGERLTHLQGPIPVRRPEMEARLLRTLESGYGLSPGQRVRVSGQEAIALADRIRSGGRAESAVHGTGHTTFFQAPGLRAELRVQGDDFTVAFLSGEGGSTAHAEASRVVAGWQRGESLVPLVEGGWAPLPSDFLARYGGLLADLLAAKAATEDGRLPRGALPDLARLCVELEQPEPPGFERLRVLTEAFDELPRAPLPSDLRAVLRDYQRRGVDWLCFLRSAGMGALLADDMGLGKTLQALCCVTGRSLVVAPTSVVHNWLAEIRRFRPSLTTCLYHGPKRELDAGADVTLTTYAILRLDAELLASVTWGTLVLDEAQAIKNPDSQVARSAYRLSADFRIAMTGTPVENRLDELWSQFHAVHRGLLGGREDFRDRVVRPILDGDPGAAARLRERIRPFVLRRLKKNVAPELPPRTEVILRCELSDHERALYESIRGSTLPAVVEQLREGGNVMAALEALLRLRQAACHPSLLPGQKADASSKTELLVETLERATAGGHKSLVFSQWTSLLDCVEPMLRQAGLSFTRLDGSTRDREGVVASFQSDDGPPVMLVSLKAGGTGLNLTAADHVFMLDPWWNPAVEDQAADRAHRIGQDRPVIVHKLVARDTVEERIIELQDSKRAIADVALGGSERAGSLRRDDLLAILS